MELNITEAFNAIIPRQLSGSQAELGYAAGEITWNNAMAAATGMKPLDTAAKREAFRRYVKGFAAWDDAEISAWTPLELNALALQCIAAEMREGGLDDGATWEEYEEMSHAGQCAGNLFRGDDGAIYYYLGG